MNRREFAYFSALAGVVIDQAQSKGREDSSKEIPDTAGLLSEMIFLDDCVRIAMYDDGISKNAKKVLTSYSDFVRNGSLAPASLEAASGEKFALACGRLFSGALAKHRENSSAECRLYQDVAVMRDLAATAGRDPAKAAEVLDLLNLLHSRRRLGLHTLNPDSDIQVWLEGIVKWWREQQEWRASLAAVYTSPDNAKLKKYTAEFYNPADPLISVARRFQFAEVAPPDIFKQAMLQAPHGSHYARALNTAIVSLRSVGTVS